MDERNVYYRGSKVNSSRSLLNALSTWHFSPITINLEATTKGPVKVHSNLLAFRLPQIFRLQADELIQLASILANHTLGYVSKIGARRSNLPVSRKSIIEMWAPVLRAKAKGISHSHCLPSSRSPQPTSSQEISWYLGLSLFGELFFPLHV